MIMFASNNEIRLVCNLVSDPEVFNTQNGDAARMRVASNTRFSNGNERTCFIDVKCFSNAYKDLQYYQIKQGDKVTVVGELVSEEWEKDGQKRSTYTIYAARVLKVARMPKVDSGEGGEGGDSNF